MHTVRCTLCPEEFQAGRISEAMNARRFHMEQRHLEGEIETDTSTQR